MSKNKPETKIAVTYTARPVPKELDPDGRYVYRMVHEIYAIARMRRIQHENEQKKAGDK